MEQVVSGHPLEGLGVQLRPAPLLAQIMFVGLGVLLVAE